MIFWSRPTEASHDAHRDRSGMESAFERAYTCDGTAGRDHPDRRSEDRRGRKRAGHVLADRQAVLLYETQQGRIGTDASDGRGPGDGPAVRAGDGRAARLVRGGLRLSVLERDGCLRVVPQLRKVRVRDGLDPGILRRAADVRRLRDAGRPQLAAELRAVSLWREAGRGP